MAHPPQVTLAPNIRLLVTSIFLFEYLSFPTRPPLLLLSEITRLEAVANDETLTPLLLDKSCQFPFLGPFLSCSPAMLLIALVRLSLLEFYD